MRAKYVLLNNKWAEVNESNTKTNILNDEIATAAASASAVAATCAFYSVSWYDWTAVFRMECNVHSNPQVKSSVQWKKNAPHNITSAVISMNYCWKQRKNGELLIEQIPKNKLNKIAKKQQNEVQFFGVHVYIICIKCVLWPVYWWSCPRAFTWSTRWIKSHTNRLYNHHNNYITSRAFKIYQTALKSIQNTYHYHDKHIR